MPPFRVGWVRRQVASHLTDSASLLRVTLVDDSAGGRLRTETELGPYPFRLQTAEAFTGTALGQEDAQANRIRAVSRWVGFFAAGTDVRPADIVLHAGIRYEVVEGTGARSDSVTVAVALRRVE